MHRRLLVLLLLGLVAVGAGTVVRSNLPAHSVATLQVLEVRGEVALIRDGGAAVWRRTHRSTRGTVWRHAKMARSLSYWETKGRFD